MIKNILGRIWALWGLISFILTFLIILPISLIAYLFKNYKKGQDYFIGVARIWMRIWLTLIGCPLTVRGLENYKKGEQYIVTYNHNALLDVPLSAPFVGEGNKTIAKDSFSKIPVFNLYYNRGSILVNRNSERSRIKSFEEMKWALNNGMHMCIYPEGTRNRTPEPLKKFYDGAFKLSVDTGKSIMPAIIVGTKSAMPVNKTFFLWPNRLYLFYLPPVSPSGKTTAELRNEVFEIMKTAYLEKISIHKP